MPRILTVSEIRRSLYEAAGGPRGAGSGQPSVPLLGQLFHETFATLTGPDEQRNFVRPFERADASIESWRRQLKDHTYLWHVGPQLLHYQATLREQTPAVIAYWEAIEHLCTWLAEVLWNQHRPGQSVEALRTAIFFRSEEELSAELTDPLWSDSVVVQGRADAVLRQPATGAFCLLELKLGRTTPEVDLCQACLYHLLFREDPERPQAGELDLALLTFEPERREHHFSASQLAEAHTRLKALVGQLAGVIGAPPRHHVSPYQALGQQVIEAFAEFGARLRLEGEPLVGPTFIRFFAVPEWRVRARQVVGLGESAWTRLQTDQPPQIMLKQGRIAIDVQRPDRQTVFWKDLRSQLPQPSSEGSTRFPVGVTVDGSLRWADLAEPENCHILVAGAAGSGKSEWLRAMIASLLASNRPETLRLVLIDPKRVAFSLFEGSSFLVRPVVYPSDIDVLEVLDALIEEMEHRYQLLAANKVDDLRAYNERSAQPLPRTLCFCDEYADLVLGSPRRRQEIEARVARLGQKGRAAGFHLVLATQRPSRDIVRGVINANLVARVALKVVGPIESRLILNHPGAATLLGKGDLLFKDLGDPVRLQAPYVTNNDLRTLLESAGRIGRAVCHE